MESNIPLFPLSHGVFPDGMLVLQIFEVRYLDLIKRSHQQQLPFGVVWLKTGREVQVPSETPSLHAFGCLAHIKEFEQLQANLFRVICQGGARFTLHDTQPGPFGVWQGDVTYLPDDPEVQIPKSFQQHADRLGNMIATAQQQGQSYRLPIFAPNCLDQCGWVANRYAEAMSISSAEKMKLLCELDPIQRIQKVDLLFRDA